MILQRWGKQRDVDSLQNISPSLSVLHTQQTSTNSQFKLTTAFDVWECVRACVDFVSGLQTRRVSGGSIKKFLLNVIHVFTCFFTYFQLEMKWFFGFLFISPVFNLHYRCYLPYSFLRNYFSRKYLLHEHVRFDWFAISALHLNCNVFFTLSEWYFVLKNKCFFLFIWITLAK